MQPVIVADRLLKHLKSSFTDKLPLKSDVTLADIHRQQGEQNVIRYLESLNNQTTITDEVIANVSG